MIQAAALSGAAAAPLAACAQPRRAPDAPRVDVRAFGAVGDGRTDDTAAFNRATAAAERWSEGLLRSVHVPAGTYRIDGTVHIRNGQDLTGDGYASLIDASHARGETFALGTGADGGTDTAGPPVSVRGLRTLGGSGDKPLIAVRTHGFLLRDLFLSAAGTAIQVGANDGLIADIDIDQALNGVVLRDCQNIVASGLVVYSANQAVVLGRNARTIGITGATFCYARYGSVIVEEGATGVRDVRFTGAHFVTNVQPATFLGHVHLRGVAPQLDFTGCSFRNWPGAAIRHGAGHGGDLGFAGCTFDATKPTADFNNSSTAAGVTTGPGTRFRFDGCTFRGLHGPLATLLPGTALLAIDGGTMEDCTGPLLSGEADALSLREVAGFGAGERGAVLLPLIGAAWKLAVTGRAQGGGRFSAELLCEVAGGAARVRPLWVSGAATFRATVARDRLVVAASGGAIERWRVSTAA